MSGRGSSGKKLPIGIIAGIIVLTVVLVELFGPVNTTPDSTPVTASPSPANTVSSVGSTGTAQTIAPGFSPAPVAGSGGKLVVYALDVGQGDCFLLVSPSGMTMLIDAGESKNSDNISEFLIDSSISCLDVVVATHPHSDHIGAMAEIIDEFDVGTVYMPQAAHDTKTYERLIASINENDIELIEAWGGEDSYIEWDESCPVQLLSPLRGGEYSSFNDWSIMLRVEYGKDSMLFTGDAETHAESFAMYNLPESCFDATVLKVGHHGSTTSSSSGFLSAVSPEVAIISVGEDNDYGHPDPSTLEKLRLVGAEVYRTDQCGNIRLIFDGSEVSIETHYQP